MRPAQAVMFDLDGTLADTLEDIGSAMNRALAAAGFPPHEPAAYRQFIGEGVEALAGRALPASELGRRDEIVAGFRRLYAERVVDRTRPYAGIPALLDALGDRRVPLAVLSNKPEPATVAIVEQLFGPGRFAAVAGALVGRPRKPDPWRALEIAGALAVPPAAWLFVGDSAIDMDTARAAGMAPIGVAWGFRERSELGEHGARGILEHPRELLALVER